MAESKQILPLKVLSINKCNRCFKYLSVGPIVIGANKENICGRCVDVKNSKLFFSSLYNTLAKQFVFKCVNHFDGCNVLLEFNEAAEHEKVCIGKSYSCPFCPCKGICCQLVEHFRRFHSASVVKESKFKILLNEDYKRCYVFIKHQHIYIIKLFTDIVNGEIRFSLHYLKTVTFVLPKLRFHLSSSENLGLEYNMEKFKYLDSTDSSTKYIFSYKVDIQNIVTTFGEVNYAFCKISMGHTAVDVMEYSVSIAEYEKLKQQLEIKQNVAHILDMEKLEKVSNERQKFSETCKQLSKLLLDLPFTCSVCGYAFILFKIFRCAKNHMCCQNCRGNACGSCANKYMFTIPASLDLSKIMNLPCSWENCNHVNIDFFKFQTHHRDCQLRIINCPLVNCKWSGYFEDLAAHWHCTQWKLVCNDVLVFECNSALFTHIFWAIPSLKELFLVKFYVFYFSLNEHHTILKNYYKYSLTGVIQSELKTITFWGRNLSIVSNLQGSYTLRIC